MKKDVGLEAKTDSYFIDDGSEKVHHKRKSQFEDLKTVQKQLNSKIN